jgi:phospholipase/carboxylesterase
MDSGLAARHTSRSMSAATLLPCVELEPEKAAQWSVIWMHGLGADGHDFAPVPPHLGIEQRHAVRFVFPHAPRMPVSINNGFVMPAWYDIRDGDLRTRHDEQGIAASALRIRALIAREVERGMPSQRIFLAGFSQGGAMAVHVALRHEQPLAGILALSTYLVCGDTLEAQLQSANRGIRCFVAHGLMDPMVPISRGQNLRERLVQLGCEVEWHTYPMQHSVCEEELADIGGWFNRCMG